MDRIICADVLDGLSHIQADSVDLVVTSPPYNLGIEYAGSDDKMPWPEYYEWCRGWLAALRRVMRPDGRLCLNHYFSCGSGVHRDSPLMTINHIAIETGFHHHAVVLWNDGTGHFVKRTAWGSWLSASSPYINCPQEGILILYKDHWKRDEGGESTITAKDFMEGTSGVWRMQPEMNRTHPAPFPIRLPILCIELLSYKHDLVLDPFMGSGTTLLAAKLLRRRYLGIDISKAYCDMARHRLAQESLEAFV